MYASLYILEFNPSWCICYRRQTTRCKYDLF